MTVKVLSRELTLLLKDLEQKDLELQKIAVVHGTRYMVKTRCMVKTDTKLKFSFAKLIKTWIKGKPQMSIVFTLLSNKSQSQFGVVKATESYLEVTKTWRVKGTIPKILSSNNEPHQV